MSDPSLESLDGAPLALGGVRAAHIAEGENG